jgi:hypothetical protein
VSRGNHVGVDVFLIQQSGDPTKWFVEGYQAGTTQPAGGKPARGVEGRSLDHARTLARELWGRRIVSFTEVQR